MTPTTGLKHTLQNIFNWSFDPDITVTPAVIALTAGVQAPTVIANSLIVVDTLTIGGAAVASNPGLVMVDGEPAANTGGTNYTKL